MMWKIFQKPDINKLKSNNDQKRLLKLLKSKKAVIREEAVRVLGEIHAVSAKSELIKLLLDHEPTVRLAVVESLTSIGWHPTNAEERVLWFLARDRVDEAINLEESDIPIIISVLGNIQIPLALRKSAALALGEKWNDEAVIALAFSLGCSDESLKWAVEQSLVKIGNAAIDKLQEVVSTDLEMEFGRQQANPFRANPFISLLANEIKERAKKVIEKIQRVLNLKKLFEQRYRDGYFITKRGEEPPAEKDKKYVVDLVELGKWIISWHSQRPNIAYSETKIFDKYFERLFKREYDPENIQALNFWMQEIMKGWNPENLFGLNESLLAMKAYVPYHTMYAVSQFFAIASNQWDRVPSPKLTYQQADKRDIVEQIVKMAASCLNVAIETAANEQSSSGEIFSPQNWIKAKTCLSGIKRAIMKKLTMIHTFSEGEELKEALKIPNEAFEYRWEVD